MTLYISTTAVSDGQRGSGGGGVNRVRLSLSADTKMNEYKEAAMAWMHRMKTWRQFVQKKPPKPAQFNKSSWVISPYIIWETLKGRKSGPRTPIPSHKQTSHIKIYWFGPLCHKYLDLPMKCHLHMPSGVWITTP